MQKTENTAKKNIIILMAFMLIMVGLGISDSSRGVFSSIFEKDLVLTKPQVSMIVTASYVGNLLFVSLGGKAADKFDRKKVVLCVLAMWTLAQVLFACTDNYECLLIGMFFSMGASTLLNTLMNLLSPLFFGRMAGMFVNVLFFVQGIGTSSNQKITGGLASGYGDFRLLCLGLSFVGTIGMLLLAVRKFPKEEPGSAQKDETRRVTVQKGDLQEEVVQESVSREGDVRKEDSQKGAAEKGSSPKSKQFLLYKMVIVMGLVFGFYFVAEHGIMNWWSMYCQQGLGLSNVQASTGVALFFGTMTVGRLVLAPLVQKLGIRRSIVLLGGAGTAVYILGVLLGANGAWILGCSGIFISIIYPTIVLFMQEIFPKESVATATGLIISIGTVFDIVFNAVFGSLVELAGFGICRVIFPVAMAMFYGGFLMSGRDKVELIQ